jgi:chemotaxis protein MotB
LEAAIKQTPNVAKLKDQVQMTVTGEGLRIELLESAANTFFETGNAQPTTDGKEMLDLLASELGKLPNRLSVEGHTDSSPYVSTIGYSNWELSTDRANSARKLVQQSGVRSDQVADVRGFADQRLRKPEAPTSASNRRVSIVVKYLSQGDGPAPTTPSGPTAAGTASPQTPSKVPAQPGLKVTTPASVSPTAGKPSVTPVKPPPSAPAKGKP